MPTEIMRQIRDHLPRIASTQMRTGIDRWKIAIYLYSSESYTEAELPTSFSPVTGTPEEGVNRTFPLYAGPRHRP